MNLLQAAQQALTELERLHGTVEPCDGIKTCPCAKAIRDLRRAIETENPSGGRLRDASTPPDARYAFSIPNAAHDPSADTAE